MELDLITGGGSGIGAAIAQRLGQRGDRVIIADNDRAAGERTQQNVGAGAQFRSLDVSDASAWQALHDDIFAHHQRIDTLVLNAGVMSGPRGAAVEETSWQWFTRDSYDRVMSVNQTGAVNGLLTFIPRFLEQEGGQILVVASVDALIPYPQDPFYAMTKASLLSLVRSLAPTLSRSGVKINAICPYAVATELTPANYRDVSGRGMTASEFAEAAEFVLGTSGTGEVWLKPPSSKEPVLHDFSQVAAVDRLY